MKDTNEYVDEIGALFNDEIHGFRSEVYGIVEQIKRDAREDAIKASQADLEKLGLMDEVNRRLGLFPVGLAAEEKTKYLIHNNPYARVLGRVVEAWESLPGGKSYSATEVQEWLVGPMKSAIDLARGIL